MNHGYCENCWWNKIINKKITLVTDGGIKELSSKGQCYMHNLVVNGDSYCPDYSNRKKEEKIVGTLQDWINSHKIN